MRNFLMSVFVSVFMMIIASSAWAAVGCTLNDPDRDIRRLFPDATGYKTDFITLEENGGEALAREIEEKLGDTFDSVYETLDVPYAYYTVLQGKDPIGYVAGVNQKGMFGGMQLILATDLEGIILDFYYQKISSPEAKRFRDGVFREKFVGLSLNDFYKIAITGPEAGQPSSIRDPSQKSRQDFLATLRGIKKNLLLLDTFKLGNRDDAELTSQGEFSK